MKRYFAIAFAALFFCQMAFAADENCEISTANSDEFLLEFVVNTNGSAIAKMDIGIPYSIECAEKTFGSTDAIQSECGKETVSDALYRFSSLFIISTSCFFYFDNATSRIILKTISSTEKLARLENGFWEIRFNKWETESSQKTKNALQIVLPEGSEIVSFFPQKNSKKNNNVLSWEEIPAEPIGIKYSLSPKATQADQSIPLIAIGLLLAMIVILFPLANFLFQRKINQTVLAFDSEEKKLKKEMQEIKVDYFKRRIDEEAYKSLIMEKEERIVKLKAEKDSFLQKEANKNKKPGI